MNDGVQLRELLLKIRYDTTAIQAKLTDALTTLDSMNIPDKTKIRCPTCGLPFPGPNTLAEHQYTSHQAPLPDVWQHTDQLADSSSR